MLGEFKDAMSRFPSGVVVVSARHRSGFRGLTASSFIAVSADPPMVLVSIESLTLSREAVEETGAYNVSVLERSQEFVAERFAGRAPLVDPLWREVPHELGANGLPIVTGCVAWFECELNAMQEAGDHHLALGLVTAAGARAGEPMLYWNRRFWRLG